MRISNPLQVIPYTCPFKTVGKSGFSRKINALLRDTVWDNFLAGLEADEEDYFIFPTPDVPKKFYCRKYAIVVYDIASWHNPSITTLGGRIFAQALPESTKNAHRLITISDYTAQDIAKEFGISKERIIVAPCGLSEIYKFDAAPIQQVNAIDIPKQYFLHIGTFAPHKNLPFLIKVYEQFRKVTGNSGKDIKLFLTGGQPKQKYRLSVLDQIRNSPYASDILILGKVNSKDLPSLYKGATAFIFPSTIEGFGIPVIEALSQGTPVLINANTSLTQFREFGATVINNFEVNNWADILKSITLSGKRIEKSFVSKTVNYFSWDRTARIVGKSLGLVDC